MKLDTSSVLFHLEEVLTRHSQYESEFPDFDGRRFTIGQLTELFVAYQYAFERCCPPGSVYERLVGQIVKDVDLAEYGPLHNAVERLEGVLRALQREWCGDRLQTFTELVHAEMFGDMLKAAAYLLEEGGYHGPAAVMAGAVLEQHIRRLCEKNGISTTTTAKDGETIPKKLEAMNAELQSRYANGKQDQKEVTTLAGLRNQAAHGEFEKFDEGQVDLMIQSIRGFINRNSA